MTQIRIDTEHVREVGGRVASDGDRLAEIGHELQQAIDSLDTGAWDGHSRRQAEPMLDRVRPEGERAAERLRDLGRQLTHIAQAFEEADGRGAAGVDTVPWFVPQRVLGWQTDPALQAGMLLVGGGAGALTPTMLQQFGVERASFIQKLKELPESVAAWLAPAVASVAGLFGWQKEKPPVEIQTGTPNFVPAPPPGPPDTGVIKTEITSARVPNRDLTPTLKQTSGSYECAPTAASMVLEYWNTIDPENETRTPQDLIKGFGGLYDPKSGMNANELVQGLKDMKLGYDTIEWESQLSKSTLKETLKEGPVMAQVHLNWGSSGNAHMVTVTGMSDDGKTVYVNDPWTGKTVKKSWGDFERSWSFSYKKASHLIVKIRP